MEKSKRDEERKRHNSAFLVNRSQVQDDQTEKIERLELLLKEERKKREFLERQWSEVQYDETWDKEEDGLESWREEDVHSSSGRNVKRVII